MGISELHDERGRLWLRRGDYESAGVVRGTGRQERADPGQWLWGRGRTGRARVWSAKLELLRAIDFPTQRYYLILSAHITPPCYR